MRNQLFCNLGISHSMYKPRLSDNFFQIGGTSINAVAVVSKINKYTSISIEDFIQAKTLGELIMNETGTNQTNLKSKESATDNIEVSHKIGGFISPLWK